ncbi:MAG: GNAT family N-acetyltransferase [Deferribacteres bacterium]|nr:GNAT family N-acetyltransferase [candidate division KSB1 bacterium]MCB9511854.1 GNAT family N-acetyltransferase [Deferribacteres bacterium]
MSTSTPLIQIKRLAAPDHNLAAELVDDFSSAAQPPDHMQRFLQNPDNYLLTATINGATAGFLLAHALDRLKEDAQKMFIYEIEVAKQYRRKGIGRALIRHIVALARQRKMLSAFVLTNRANNAAVELYRATGATVPNDDDVLFEYRL